MLDDPIAKVLLAFGFLVWLLLACACLVEVRRDQRHRRDARLRVLAQRREHGALDDEEQHDEADNGADEGEEKFHAPSVSVDLEPAYSTLDRLDGLGTRR